MTNGRDDTSGGRRRHSKNSVPNENRLAALGEAVDGQSGVKVRRPRRRRSTGKKWAIAGVIVVLIIAGVVGGSYGYARWRFDRIPKVTVAGEEKPISGQPFNILMIGSDSRAGLSGMVAKQTGATTGSVAGQRSDVVKIIHIDPNAGTISMISIPRDTMVTLLANQSLYGQFNRINVNFGNGPSLLAQTITANFAPISTNFTSLVGNIVTKAGPSNARVWTLSLTDNGPAPAIGSTIDTFSLTQTAGAACTPVITNLAAFPLLVGDLAVTQTGIANVTIDFTGCVAAARFTATFTFSANAGFASGTATRTNQFQ